MPVTRILKYPTMVVKRLHPKGTQVIVATQEEMRKLWPNLIVNPDSPQIGVWFPDMPHPTIVAKSQLE